MSAPIYHKGLQPRTPDELHEDCVRDYPTSLRRPQIWDGIIHIVKTTAAIQPVDGDLIVDNEFVELTQEPAIGTLALLCKCQVTRQLLEFWRKESAPETDCETYLLPPAPEDPTERADWEAAREALIDLLTDVQRKGVPVVDFKSCLSHTRS